MMMVMVAVAVVIVMIVMTIVVVIHCLGYSFFCLVSFFLGALFVYINATAMTLTAVVIVVVIFRTRRQEYRHNPKQPSLLWILVILMKVLRPRKGKDRTFNFL